MLHNAHLVAFHNGVCTVVFKQHADERAFRNDLMYAALNAPIFFGFERVADEAEAVERVDALNTLLNFRVAEHARVGCKVAAFLRKLNVIIGTGLTEDDDEIDERADAEQAAGEDIQNTHANLSLIKFMRADDS